MNTKEFAALKAGDKVENAMLQNGAGTVTEVIDQGVKVRWGDSDTGPEFTYVVNSTAWMHWNKVEP